MIISVIITVSIAVVIIVITIVAIAIGWITCVRWFTIPFITVVIFNSGRCPLRQSNLRYINEAVGIIFVDIDRL